MRGGRLGTALLRFGIVRHVPLERKVFPFTETKINSP